MFLSQGVTAFHISLLQPQGAGAPAAVLVHAAVSDTQQQVLYGALCDAAQESHEWQALSRSAPSAAERPYPLCVWRHPYTQQTNARHTPQLVLDWAHGLAETVARVLSEESPAHGAAAASIDQAKYDSLISILYAPGGTLRPHVDAELRGHGLALSLGASCTFDFGGAEVELRSGDVLFAQFGTVCHAVLATQPAAESAPAWWCDEARRFGRDRCSLQLRDRAWSLRPHPTDAGKLVRRTVRRVG